MIETINKVQKKKYKIVLISVMVASFAGLFASLTIGQYGVINPVELCKVFLNFFGANFSLPPSYSNIIEYIRLPRALASFFVGGALSVSVVVYQNTFNNKLVSPDILGVSAGSCVGAGIAILLGLNNVFISVFAFVFGFLAVIIALVLPIFFRNKSTITLVLSGIIVGAFMNSIIGLIKYLADQDDKLAAITFWMMGSVTGISMKEVLCVLPLIAIPLMILLLMSHRIDVVSLGSEEAHSLGINFKRNRLVIIICSTSLPGNVFFALVLEFYVI